ncbi:MAG: MarR family transcriptional regulator [Planctomycetota bacterium]
MEPEPAAEQFVELFHDVFLRFHDRRPASDRGLSLEAVGVLEHLARTGPLTVTEAAQHFGRSQAATSEIVARLEGRGLLMRFSDERDRRRHLVWLTEAGLAAWRHAQRVLDASLLAEAFATLSDRQRQDCLRALGRLLQAPLPTDQPKET